MPTEVDLVKTEMIGFPKMLAVFVGVALFFFVGTVPASVLGDYSRLLVPIDIAAYGVAGIVFGFVWPKVGWRLGLYLFAVWPPMLLFMLFLGGEALMARPVNSKGILRDLLGYLLIGVAACLGAALGAFIRRQRATSLSSG